MNPILNTGHLILHIHEYRFNPKDKFWAGLTDPGLKQYKPTVKGFFFFFFFLVRKVECFSKADHAKSIHQVILGSPQ